MRCRHTGPLSHDEVQTLASFLYDYRGKLLIDLTGITGEECGRHIHQFAPMMPTAAIFGAELDPGRARFPASYYTHEVTTIRNRGRGARLASRAIGGPMATSTRCRPDYPDRRAPSHRSGAGRQTTRSPRLIHRARWCVASRSSSKAVTPGEAWAFAQRACGVCTTVHSFASIRSVEDALDIQDSACGEPDPEPDDRPAVRARPRHALLSPARPGLG